MLQTNIDDILDWTTKISWLLFAIYTLIVFIQIYRANGFVRALLLLFSFRVLVPLLLVVGLSLFSLSLVFIQPQEVGVVVSVMSPGGVRPQPLRAGLHFIIPLLESEVKYPIYWQTYTMSAKLNEGAKRGDDSIRARTSDGQEIRLDCSIIFRVDQDKAVTLHIDWQARYIEDLVRPVIRGFVRTQVSQFTVREVNSSSRKDLESTLDRLLLEEFNRKGLIVDQFLLRDITFTDQYAASIEEKQIAQEGIEQTLHQAQQVRNRAEGERDRLKTEAEGEKEKLKIVAEGEKQKLISVAEGEAAAILLKAEAQAQALKLIGEAIRQDPNLLTYQYIEKLSPNIRVMLVPNDSPMILPLPNLDTLEPVTATLAPSVTTSLTTTTMPITTTVAPALTPIATPKPPASGN